MGPQAAERARHVQWAALDRRAHAVRRPQRRHPCRAGAQLSGPPSGAARRAAVGGLPGLERLGPQRQADRAPRPGAVRRPRVGVVRGVLGRRGGVRPAPLQHVRHPLRRDRRGLRDDLGVLLRDGRDGRLRGSGPRVHAELERIRRGEARADDEVRRQWDESQPRRGRARRRRGRRSRSAGTDAAGSKRAALVDSVSWRA
jgi:hypothetical protein